MPHVTYTCSADPTARRLVGPAAVLLLRPIPRASVPTLQPPAGQGVPGAVRPFQCPNPVLATPPSHCLLERLLFSIKPDSEVSSMKSCLSVGPPSAGSQPRSEPVCSLYLFHWTSLQVCWSPILLSTNQNLQNRGCTLLISASLTVPAPTRCPTQFHE